MKRRLSIVLIPVLCLISMIAYQKWNTPEIEINDMPAEIIASDSNASTMEKDILILPEGERIQERFVPPGSYKRTVIPDDSFESYLRELPLKPHGSFVHYYDGTIKRRSNVYDAVVDMDIGERDLQQCADAIMRLRAEYLYGQGRYDEILFHLTNGFPVDYQKWRNGYRIALDGNRTYWVKKTNASDSYQDFRKYLNLVFAYAGTLSLSKELEPITLSEMQIGDVFIQGGSPGHAVIVVDMAEHNETGRRIFLLAQSYMPAQEIQILKNPMDEEISPWYTADFEGPLQTPEWTFYSRDLKRFPN
ncbi:DUF4846 domain-containing protein [Geosporobacter ferrireducens]|uniref:DUF4846 domain-containing protein n=1 Tax=Geosporobacter ferrireducens TaxID=1424294 RepID=A0A1D8GMT2_9FIRM|nr:DUF4846 domain-containing protein [Geosporobacter ferrireducens]AOT72142.1 hypothetical protein Gferi_22930 [Geosporobacter ferrireducens]MTI56030.1 hypothetical protein [Geosporobacter ferrireducens]